MRVLLVSMPGPTSLPYDLELGRSLVKAGHHVSLFAIPQAKARAEAAGLEHRESPPYDRGAVQGDPKAAVEFETETLRRARELVPRADVVVSNPWREGVLLLARHLGVPCCRIASAPVALPSRHHGPMWLRPGLPEVINELAWRAHPIIVAQWQVRVLGAWNALGLPPISRVPPFYEVADLVVIRADASVMPLPDDARRPSWRQTNWFFPKSDAEPPPELESFLAAGPPPVWVGWQAHYLGREPKRTANAILEGLVRSGQRGIVLEELAKAADRPMPEGVFVVPQRTGFGTIRPGLAAAVHGGVGDPVGYAARAGVPQVILPSTYRPGVPNDTQYIAHAVHRAGLAPPPLALEELDPDAMARAIRRAATESSLRARAAEVAEVVAASSGPDQATHLLEELVRAPARGSDIGSLAR